MVSIPFSDLFFIKDSLGIFMVCHIEGLVGTKVMKSALRMLTLYMCFNGTDILGGETVRGRRAII